ncbi:hypothetical protein L596_025140 [Steinernema carpocapsae]|uniref:Peptidase S1 domain-containing protein n=1 Tax=Steinernema carpocapsae TaxID=34508 RepID=A0A4U5M7S2_STECR|nr:hypothetical protein L596_025140 [Steinernema carpocapsae]
MGFGENEDDPENPKTQNLTLGRAKIMDRTECAVHVKNFCAGNKCGCRHGGTCSYTVTDTEFCVRGHSYSTHGDSGGPVVSKFPTVQIGVISHGFGNVDVFVKVSKYCSFIESATKNTVKCLP